MKMKNLQDLFIAELRDLYSAEKQLLKALPRMAKAASSDELREGFEEHLEQTEGQVERLEQIFERLEVSSRGKKCLAMEGLIAEGKEQLEEDMDDPVRDAAIIAAAQKVEHYEIAGYGTACAFARLLGDEESAELLQETLNEEKETDEKLTQLAESAVNVEALAGAEDE